MKKRHLIVVSCIALCMLSLGVVSFLVPDKTNGDTVVYASSANPEIIATAHSIGFAIPVNSADVGTLQINGSVLPMNGSAQGQHQGTGSVPTIRATALRNYEVDRIEVWECDRSVTTTFTHNTSITFTAHPNGGLHGALPILDDDITYRLDVYFKLASYTLNVINEYHSSDRSAYEIPRNVSRDISSELSNATSKQPLRVHPAVSDVKLGETISLQNDIVDVSEGYRLAYAEIIYKDTNSFPRSYVLNLSEWVGVTSGTADDIYEIIFSGAILQYADADNVIHIIGVYSKTILVEVDFADNYGTPPPTLSMTIISPFVTVGTETIRSHNGVLSGYLDINTTMIFAIRQNYNYVKYDHILVNSAPTSYHSGDIWTLGVVDCKIEIVYVPRGYEVTFIALDNNGQPVLDDCCGEELILTGSSVTVTGLTNGFIQLGDKVTNIAFDDSTMLKYKLVGFSVQRNSINLDPGAKRAWFDIFPVNEVITDTFFQTYLINGRITIVVDCSLLYALNFVDNYNSSLVKVFKADELGAFDFNTPVDMTRNYFPAGTILRIEVTDEAYRIFQDFGGLSTDEKNRSDARGKYARVEIVNMARDINLVYMGKTFAVDEEENIDFHGDVLRGTDDMITIRVNATIAMTYHVPKNNEIKSWKINNHDYRFYGDASVVRLDKATRTLYLTLTPEVLHKLGVTSTDADINFNNSVNIGLKAGLITAITLPGLIVPVLAAVLLAFMFIHYKRKKLIKAQLTAERSEKIKRNVGGYIDDLRQGNITGNISNEDVKKAMKQQKEDKKVEKVKQKQQVKSVEAEPALTQKQSQAVKATRTVMSSLDGCALLPDKTIVDKNKKKVARLQNDGSIVDLNGKAFAKVSLETGQITDEANNILGSIGGDGRINK